MRRVALLVALTVLVAGCGSSSSPTRTEHAATRLVDVSSVLPVRGAFNRDAGETRLLVLLSPT